MLRALVLVVILATIVASNALQAESAEIDQSPKEKSQLESQDCGTAFKPTLPAGYGRLVSDFSGTMSIKSGVEGGNTSGLPRGRGFGQPSQIDFGDAPLVMWTRYHASGMNPPDNQAYAIAVDNDGFVYVTGARTSADFGRDYCTIKMSPSGQLMWQAIYNGDGNGDDWAVAIAVDDSGNIYVTGASYGLETDLDMVTIKYDADGNEQWVARYDGPTSGEDYAYGLALDGSGNIYVVGVSWGGDSWQGGSDYDYAIVKYDSDGDFEWSVRYDRAQGWDEATAIAVDDHGNVYVTGWTWTSECAWDYTTIKLDSNGDELWVAHYDGPANDLDFARDIAVDGEGNAYVTGWSRGIGTGFDYATIKYDVEGQEQWVARFNGCGNGDDYAFKLALDSHGNPHVTGWGKGVGTGTDYFTLKYDTDGNQLWFAGHNGPGNGNDHAFDIAVDNQGNVFVTGEIWLLRPTTPFDYDFGTVKYDSNGGIQWAPGYDHYTAGSNDCASAIALDNKGCIYVTGWSAFSSATIFTTIKYYDSCFLPPDGSFKASAPQGDQPSIPIQADPNPVLVAASIGFSLPTSGFVKLGIYDVQGREVARLVEEERREGFNQVRWTPDGLPAGIYFCRLEFGSKVETSKIVLLR